MIKRSQISRVNAVLRPFIDPETVIQKMLISAFIEILKAAYAALQDFPVQIQRHLRIQRSLFIGIKCAFDDLTDGIRICLRKILQKIFLLLRKIRFLFFCKGP